jgi:hypothetical protein
MDYERVFEQYEKNQEYQTKQFKQWDYESKQTNSMTAGTRITIRPARQSSQYKNLAKIELNAARIKRIPNQPGIMSRKMNRSKIIGRL